MAGDYILEKRFGLVDYLLSMKVNQTVEIPAYVNNERVVRTTVSRLKKQSGYEWKVSRVKSIFKKVNHPKGCLVTRIK